MTTLVGLGELAGEVEGVDSGDAGVDVAEGDAEGLLDGLADATGVGVTLATLLLDDVQPAATKASDVSNTPAGHKPPLI